MYGLHHVQLAMPPGGEDEARAFFVDVLGMTEVDKPPVLAARGGAWFRAGTLELHLGVEEGFVPARKAHPGILVDDLDDAVRRLADAGIDVAPDPHLPGFERVYVDDPFGNRLELLEPSGDRGRDGHLARVRRRVGSTLLLVPSVTICLFDDRDRLLLGRHVAAEGHWATPGGAVEPDESPATTVLREAAEELGVDVMPTGVVGIFGPHRITYPNGDVTSYVTTMFAVEITGGTLNPDHRELTEIGWFGHDEATELDLVDWLRPLLPAIFGWREDGRTRFAEPE